MIATLFVLALVSGSVEINLDAHGVFVYPKLVAQADNGSLLISNESECEILLFDASGKFLKKTGRKGSGPGEFQRLNGLSWNEKLNVFLVHDAGNSRISAYSRELELTKEWQLKEFMNRPVHMTDEHIFILRDNNGDIEATPHVLRVNYHTHEKDIPYELPPLEVEYGVHFDEGGYSMFRSFEWDPQLHFALGKSFYVTTFNDFSDTSPHFYIHEISGKKHQKVSCKLAPTPFDKASIEEPIAVYSRIVKLIRKHMTIPEFWPAIMRLMVDNDRIYVFGPQSAEHQFAFEVYQSDGSLVGRGTSPFLPVLIEKGTAFGFTTKSDNVVLTKYHLETL